MVGVPCSCAVLGDLESVHGFCCYANIVPNAKCQPVLVLALCLVCIVIVRPCHSTAYTDVACCYRWSSMICLSVTIVSPANISELIEMPFGFWTSVQVHHGKGQF